MPAVEGDPSEEDEGGGTSPCARGRRVALTWTTLAHQGKTLENLTYDERNRFIASYADLQHEGVSFRHQAIDKIVIKAAAGPNRFKTKQVRHGDRIKD